MNWTLRSKNRRLESGDESAAALPAFSEHRVALLRAMLFSLLSLLLTLPATAVIIDSGDGSGNTTPPIDDPGFANVGVRGSLSGVYLRNGWILTANHVGLGDIWLDGAFYTAVPGSGTQLADVDEVLADLFVFAITPIPSLPDLEIRADTSLPTGEVILIGHGRDRGAETDTNDPGIWTDPPEHPSPAVQAWYWEIGVASLRWGTNTVHDYWTAGSPPTRSFYTVFDESLEPDHTAHECQTANGDSGGALFAKNGPDWELAGILWGSGVFLGQNSNTSAMRGNGSIAADLSQYRDDIMALTATPIPEPALVLQLSSGAALLAGLKRRRIGRS
jgi:hypothetical protein